MKVLLDECIPLDFRHHLPGHETHTVEFAGMKGLRNGQLLSNAEKAGYEVLLTIDQGIPHQQNRALHRISIVVIRSRTSQIEHLLLAVDAILRELNTIEPGQTVIV